MVVELAYLDRFLLVIRTFEIGFCSESVWHRSLVLGDRGV
jgi:hypothetical protein